MFYCIPRLNMSGFLARNIGVERAAGHAFPRFCRWSKLARSSCTICYVKLSFFLHFEDICSWGVLGGWGSPALGVGASQLLLRRRVGSFPTTAQEEEEEEEDGEEEDYNIIISTLGPSHKLTKFSHIHFKKTKKLSTPWVLTSLSWNHTLNDTR